MRKPVFGLLAFTAIILVGSSCGEPAVEPDLIAALEVALETVQDERYGTQLVGACPYSGNQRGWCYGPARYEISEDDEVIVRISVHPADGQSDEGFAFMFLQTETGEYVTPTR